MATETTTRLDAESAAVMAQRARDTADLTKGADVQVPTGSETTPPPRVNATDAIKAMYVRARDQRRAEQEAHEAAGGRNPMLPAEGDAPAHGYPPRKRDPDADTTTQAAQPPKAPPLPAQPDYVSVPFQGRQISVSARDIERAGGQEAYLRARQMEVDEDRMAQERLQIESARAELNTRVEEMRRLQAETVQSSQMTAGPGSPANGSGFASDQSRSAMDPSGKQAIELAEEAERLSTMLYSGDPNDARMAVQTILAEARTARQTVSPEQVAHMAAEMLRAAAPQNAGTTAPAVPSAPQPVNPLFLRINAMADREFPAVVSDPVQRAAAFALLQKRAMEPQNQERSAVDIAREVCEEVEMIYSNPRKGIIEVKRGLPPVPQATGTAQAPADDAPLSSSEWIAKVAKARQFGGRA